MQRSTVVALAATAVIGLGAGSATAIVHGHRADGTPAHTGRTGSPRTGGTSPQSSPSTTPTAQLPATLLYANPGVIHDGARRIVFDDNVPKVPEDLVPNRLVRVHGGYVISYDTSDQEPAQALYFIDRSGRRTHLGDVQGGWAVSPLGDRIAARNLEHGNLEVIDLTGKVVSTWAFRTDTPGWVALSWQRASVVVSAAGSDGHWKLYQWLPDTGVHDQVNDAGMADLQLSPDGGTMIGQTQPGTGVATGDANTCMSGGPALRGVAHRWTTCDWRISDVSHAFSPKGDLVLARLRASDDAGPWRVAVMVAGSGPTDSMRVVTLPDRSGDVQWLDERHLVTVVPVGGAPDDMRLWLKSCDLDSRCTTLLQSREGRIVLGEPS